MCRESFQVFGERDALRRAIALSCRNNGWAMPVSLLCKRELRGVGMVPRRRQPLRLPAVVRPPLPRRTGAVDALPVGGTLDRRNAGIFATYTLSTAFPWPRAASSALATPETGGP